MVNPGNGSFDLRKFPHDDRTRFFNSVRNGKNSMPPWKDILRPDEIESVWAYVRSGGSGTEMIADSPATGGATGGPGRGSAADKPELTVCLQSNEPPLSFRRDEKPAGFDVALSRIIAERLGRDLRIQWFVSRDDPDANPTKEANALLSDGRCQLVAEFPLATDTLARSAFPDGKTAAVRRRETR